MTRALADRRAGGPPCQAAPFREAPVANPGGAIVDLPDLPGMPRVRIEIPESIQDLKAARPDAGPAWRESTRRAFESYLARGYRVEAFYREAGHCFYGMERD